MSDWFYFFRNLAFILATTMLVKYYFFMLVAPFYAVKERSRKLRLAKRGTLSRYQPLISVIIPAWNEEVGIIKTIASAMSNTYQNIEVIVVNDGSTDNSDTIIRQHIDVFDITYPYRAGSIRYFFKENGGKGRALNFGIEQAYGEIIVTVDADSALEPHALERLKDYFADPTISAVVGNVKISRNPTLVGLLQTLEYQFGFYFKRTHAVLGAEYIFGGACAAFRRDVFERYGLFDEANKTEDIEMSMRLRFNGVRCTYAENVICYTEGASTIKGLINQRLRWKKGRFDTFVKYRMLFFSWRRGHNKSLSTIVLPYALLSEFQLLVEPISIALLTAYSVISSDYLSLTLGMLFIFTIYLINAVFGHEGFRLKTLLLFPFTWPLFYLLVWVEFLALLRTIVMIYRGTPVEWQRWDRKGVRELPV